MEADFSGWSVRGVLS